MINNHKVIEKFVYLADCIKQILNVRWGSPWKPNLFVFVLLARIGIQYKQRSWKYWWKTFFSSSNKKIQEEDEKVEVGDKKEEMEDI